MASAGELAHVFTNAGFECSRVRTVDPLAEFDPKFVQAPATSGVVCAREADAAVFFYAYANDVDREGARQNGEINICRLEPFADAAHALVADNWRIASIDRSAIFREIEPMLPDAQTEEISCLNVD